jgi:peptidoglycan/LPS O-acetylase OafA/YrhL
MRFYLARIARVMPLYWVVLAFLMLRTHMQGRSQAEWWLHALAVHTWSGDLRIGQQSYNGPAWSVCIEIFLYALFPVLVPVVALIARRFGAAGLLVLAGAAFAVQVVLCVIFSVKGWADLSPFDPASGHRWLYRNPLTRLPDFIIGVSLAFLLMRGATARLRSANLAQLVCVVAVLIVASIRPESGLARALFYGAMWTVPFAIVLFTLAAAPAAGLSRFLATRAMVQLGAASYALYLTHRWLIDGFGAATVRRGGFTAYLMVLAILGLTLLVAEGAHRYIEVPSRKAILRLARRPTANVPASAAPDEAPGAGPDARPDAASEAAPPTPTVPRARDGAEEVPARAPEPARPA